MIAASPSFILVGCGRIGRRHAEIIAGTYKLVAVCDTNAKALDDFTNAYNVPGFLSFSACMEAQITADAVVIATPNALHASQCILALNAGYHVLCEKPMALTRDATLRMQEAALKAGKLLWVVKQNRYNPPVELLHSLVRDKALGNIFQVHISSIWNRDPEYYLDSWKGSATLDGGTLYTQFSHFIDAAIWLFGDIREVGCVMDNKGHQGIIDFEDGGILTGKFKSGAIFSMAYSVNSTRSNMEGSLTVLAEKGTVKIGGQFLNELDFFEVEGMSMPELPAGRPANSYGKYSGSMSNHEEVYVRFIDCFTHNKPGNETETAALTASLIQRFYQLNGRQPADIVL